MKYVDEFRSSSIAKNISKVIFEKAKGLKPINIMEVCGTHTMAICDFGIRELIPENIKLISGPGCPVCVTPKAYIDNAIALSRVKDVFITTFGDMLRVPGSHSSLMEERSAGRVVKALYSPLDAVSIAEENKNKKIIFLGIGFETTSPTIASSLEYAKKKNLNNFFVYAGHKLIIPAMQALLEDRDINIDAFLCPAHVSAIIGAKPYGFIANKYKKPCVVTGFEPLDILQGVLMIIEQILKKNAKVENQYKRVVKPNGNTKALKLLERVFDIKDSEWRGLGIIKNSSFELKSSLRAFNVWENFSIPKAVSEPDKGCICGSVLKGMKTPLECRLFRKACTPHRPKGACMVSSEGTCAAYFKNYAR